MQTVQNAMILLKVKNKKFFQNERVVVTGIGLLTSIGNNKETHGKI